MAVALRIIVRGADANTEQEIINRLFYRSPTAVGPYSQGEMLTVAEDFWGQIYNPIRQRLATYVRFDTIEVYEDSEGGSAIYSLPPGTTGTNTSEALPPWITMSFLRVRAGRGVRSANTFFSGVIESEFDSKGQPQGASGTDTVNIISLALARTIDVTTQGVVFIPSLYSLYNEYTGTYAAVKAVGSARFNRLTTQKGRRPKNL